MTKDKATATRDLRLEPCPFDGGDEVVIGSGSNDGPYVRCFFCDTYIFGDSEAEVIEKWNTRAGGVGLIAKERARQLAVEGWTPEHDDHHTDQSLAQAAACYAWPPMRPIEIKKAWPWKLWEWKPELFAVDAGEVAKAEARIRVLAKAGALIAAEIDRLERARAALSSGKE
jgi:hypothetical protein